MRASLLPCVIFLQVLGRGILLNAVKPKAHCFLEIPVQAEPTSFSSSLDDSHKAALANFTDDFHFVSSTAPLHFVSYAIGGSAAVYMQSVGFTEETSAKDELGREIILKKRRLLNPDEWLQLLRVANLQLSVGLAHLRTDKAVFVVNLSADAEALSLAFSPERQFDTFLTILAWSRLPEVAEELRFFLSRVEAFVLADVPLSLAESRGALQCLLYYMSPFLETNEDLESAVSGLKLLSSLSTCSPPELRREDGEDDAHHCASAEQAAVACAERYRHHLDGKRLPRVHVSPVGDAYYLKRFISPPDMPDIYLPHSRQTLEESREQRMMRPFLAECLGPAFAARQLMYATAKPASVAVALEKTLNNMKAVLTDSPLLPPTSES